MTLEYRQSLTEINTILKYMDVEYVKRIPQKVMKFIKENMDKNYVVSIDKNNPIDKQKIKKDTRILLSLFYRYYWCDDIGRERLLAEDKKEVYEYKGYLERNNDLAKVLNQKNMQENTEKTELVENVQIVSYEKPKWYKRIFEKIKSLLLKK